jgi:hypothetical protein
MRPVGAIKPANPLVPAQAGTQVVFDFLDSRLRLRASADSKPAEARNTSVGGPRE